jgi:hypothetical protein
MNAPRADRVAAIATELGMLGRRLDALATELSTWQAGPVWPAGPAASPGSGAPYAQPPFPPAPSTQPPPFPARPFPPSPPPFPPAPLPTPAPRRSLRAWLTSLSGARLLAWTGAGVTLLGVVLLLALAAARGWFAPPVRVGAGAVLGLALVGLGMRLHRRETARTGALAVTGTGIATLFLVVAGPPRSTATCPFRSDCCWPCWLQQGGSRWPIGGAPYCSAAAPSSGRRCSRPW